MLKPLAVAGSGSSAAAGSHRAKSTARPWPASHTSTCASSSSPDSTTAGPVECRRPMGAVTEDVSHQAGQPGPRAHFEEVSDAGLVQRFDQPVELDRGGQLAGECRPGGPGFGGVGRSSAVRVDRGVTPGRSRRCALPRRTARRPPRRTASEMPPTRRATLAWIPSSASRRAASWTAAVAPASTLCRGPFLFAMTRSRPVVRRNDSHSCAPACTASIAPLSPSPDWPSAHRAAPTGDESPWPPADPRRRAPSVRRSCARRTHRPSCRTDRARARRARLTAPSAGWAPRVRRSSARCRRRPPDRTPVRRVDRSRRDRRPKAFVGVGHSDLSSASGKWQAQVAQHADILRPLAGEQHRQLPGAGHPPVDHPVSGAAHKPSSSCSVSARLASRTSASRSVPSPLTISRRWAAVGRNTVRASPAARRNAVLSAPIRSTSANWACSASCVSAAQWQDLHLAGLSPWPSCASAPPPARSGSCCRRSRTR